MIQQTTCTNVTQIFEDSRAHTIMCKNDLNSFQIFSCGKFLRETLFFWLDVHDMALHFFFFNYFLTTSAV